MPVTEMFPATPEKEARRFREKNGEKREYCKRRSRIVMLVFPSDSPRIYPTQTEQIRVIKRLGVFIKLIFSINARGVILIFLLPVALILDGCAEARYRLRPAND